MRVDILVEEPSAKIALTILLPRVLPDKIRCYILDFQDKGRLLRELDDRLKAYKEWILDDHKILVLL